MGKKKSWSIFIFQDNMDPSAPSEGENQPADQPVQRRQLTEEDEQEIWRSITLTQYKTTLTWFRNNLWERLEERFEALEAVRKTHLILLSQLHCQFLQVSNVYVEIELKYV